MKASKVILGLIFLGVFAAAAIMAIDAARCITYEDVFPDDVNAVVWVNKPLDVPLKLINSTAARNFFKTTTGKEIEKQIDQVLANITPPDDKKAPPPKIYSKNIDGVEVFFAEIPKKVEEAEVESTEGATPEAKPKKPAGKPALNRKKLEQALGIGGAAVTDMHIALYGNPMDAMMGGKPGFMFAMDLGRLSIFPRIFGASAIKAKPLPNNMPADIQFVAFAFVRNMVIAGDPIGIERMIHTLKGTPMKVTEVKTPESTESTPESTPETKISTISLKPLKTSQRWAKLKPSLNPNATLNIALILQNLLEQLMKSDPTMKDTIESAAGKFGVWKIVGLVHSNQMDITGLTLKTEFVFETPNPIIAMLNQKKKAMDWPKLLPDPFLFGAGFTADDHVALFTALTAIAPDQAQLMAEGFKKQFGIPDALAFLKVTGNERSIIGLAGENNGAMINCGQVKADAKKYFSDIEVQTAQAEVASAEASIASATEGGADSYAAEPLAKAKEALEVAKASLGEGKNVEAVFVARKSRELSNFALHFLEAKADATINAAMSAGAYTHAPDELNSASNLLTESRDAYGFGQPVAGTDKAKKSLEMAQLAMAFARAGAAIDKAKELGAETKATAQYTLATGGLAVAKATLQTGSISTAITQADLAFTNAKAAVVASGGSADDVTVQEVSDPSPPSYDLPQEVSPKVVNNLEVYRSVGEEPVDMVYASPDVACWGGASDLEAFINSKRTDPAKNANMVELMKLIPKETQALAILNAPEMIKSSGMLPEGEITTFVTSLNLMVGAYLEASNDKATLATIIPVKAFDGSTSSTARTAVVMLFFLSKWIFYLLGLFCLFMALKTFGKVGGKK